MNYRRLPFNLEAAGLYSDPSKSVSIFSKRRYQVWPAQSVHTQRCRRIRQRSSAATCPCSVELGKIRILPLNGRNHIFLTLYTMLRIHTRRYDLRKCLCYIGYHLHIPGNQAIPSCFVHPLCMNQAPRSVIFAERCSSAKQVCTI